MRDTIRGIVGKLRKGIDGYLLVGVDTKDYSIHSFLLQITVLNPWECRIFTL